MLNFQTEDSDVHYHFPVVCIARVKYQGVKLCLGQQWYGKNAKVNTQFRFHGIVLLWEGEGGKWSWKMAQLPLTSQNSHNFPQLITIFPHLHITSHNFQQLLTQMHCHKISWSHLLKIIPFDPQSKTLFLKQECLKWLMLEQINASRRSFFSRLCVASGGGVIVTYIYTNSSGTV